MSGDDEINDNIYIRENIFDNEIEKNNKKIICMITITIIHIKS